MKLKNMIPKPKPFTNKHMAATFFAFFFMFFAIFLANFYSLNLIFAIIFLVLSLHFKQAELIRETQELIKGIAEVKIKDIMGVDQNGKK